MILLTGIILAMSTTPNLPTPNDTWIDYRHGMNLSEGPHPYRDNENGILFYIEHIFMKEAAGQGIMEDLWTFDDIRDRIKTYDYEDPFQAMRIDGLYDRGQQESLNPNRDEIRTISHDNLTAIAAFSHKYTGGKEADEIAAYGLKHFFIYDNVYPHKPRISRMQWWTDWAYWAYCSGKIKYAPLYLPLFPAFLFRSFLSNTSAKDNVSTKLLNFVRFYSMKDDNFITKLLWKAHAAQMHHMYGDNWLHEIMTTYFLNPNHPNRIVSDNLNLR